MIKFGMFAVIFGIYQIVKMYKKQRDDELAFLMEICLFAYIGMGIWFV